MSLPISFPHIGPKADRFLCSQEERERYELAQKILKEQAKASGLQVVEYPDDLRSLGPVYLHEMGGLKKKERGRSLHAAMEIQPSQLLATFEGCLQTQEEFEESNPLIGEGRDITIPFGALRKCYEKTAGERDYVVRENHPTDYAGLRGQIYHTDLEKLEQGTLRKTDKVRFTFDGWRMTDHTLTLSKGRYINPLVTMTKSDRRLPELQKGKQYILGLGTMANTNDNPFGDGKGHNAELVGVMNPEGAFLISTAPIKKDEEIRTSYAIRKMFKNTDELRKSLNKKGVKKKTISRQFSGASKEKKRKIQELCRTVLQENQPNMVLRSSTLKREARV
jgi:hypothetical protein